MSVCSIRTSPPQSIQEQDTDISELLWQLGEDPGAYHLKMLFISHDASLSHKGKSLDRMGKKMTDLSLPPSLPPLVSARTRLSLPGSCPSVRPSGPGLRLSGGDRPSLIPFSTAVTSLHHREPPVAASCEIPVYR
ncbi:hypothetical protein SKAU_G00185620 [Synaphobranchus kaupii]|uniref:Uncharacterized protein n=1 Tax=Synaphobranchus kaupii TaxID=118154 RepID=A0A9Q1FD14_SYNKA|nr:hypothetical protein SKAU_G00185620 [Synaphobranchus kaupii]